MMMPSSRDLLMLFISLELVSAPGFLMAAFRKNDLKSNEAGLKFFLIGVLSTAVMLLRHEPDLRAHRRVTRLAEIAASSRRCRPSRRRWRSPRSCSSWWASRSR